MKFTAIGVHEGDSFFLEYDNKKILVDGGVKQDEVAKYLADNGLSSKFLDVIICTHYDCDHINGIVGLLKNGFDFDELWLPAIEGKIISELGNKTTREIISAISQASHIVSGFIKEKEESADRILDMDIPCQDVDEKHTEHKKKSVDVERYEKSQYYEEENIFGVEQQIDKEKDKDLRKSKNFLEHIVSCEMCFNRLAPFVDIEKYKKLSAEDKVVYSQIWNEMAHDLIKRIEYIDTSHLYSVWPKVRWLEYEKNLVMNKISKKYDLYALNSNEVTVGLYGGFELSRLLAYEYCMKLHSISPINRKSLVFMFQNEKYPDVLFNADSNHSFYSYKKVIELKRNSIVTAPHHGSFHNERVYDKIVEHGKPVNDSKLIYIRSDKMNSLVRPCERFVDLKRKYCTICDGEGNVKNVGFEYDSINEDFYVNKHMCTCKAKS